MMRARQKSAVSARGENLKFTGWADFVEKAVIFGVAH
jgi:hypothetical protein